LSKEAKPKDKSSPLKVRGGRPARQGLAGGNSLAGGGVMNITPFSPPYSKGEKDERNPYLKGNKNVVARFILAYSIM
jgi:hypothetical protein